METLLDKVAESNKIDIDQITELNENLDKLDESVNESNEINSKINTKEKNNLNIFQYLRIKCPLHVKKILLSHKLHLIIICLVILDCICISLELIIDLIVTLYNQNQTSINIEKNLTTNNIQSFNKTINIFHKIDSKLITILISIEEILKFIGLTILSFFVLEIVLKLLFIPKEIYKSIWGVCDAIVVFVSFILDIFLLKHKQILHTVTGLLTLFRLWRVTRIISGILMTMEKKSSKKIDKLLKMVVNLKKENQELKEEIIRKNLIIENLTKK